MWAEIELRIHPLPRFSVATHRRQGAAALALTALRNHFGWQLWRGWLALAHATACDERLCQTLRTFQAEWYSVSEHRVEPHQHLPHARHPCYLLGFAAFDETFVEALEYWVESRR